MPKAVYTIRLDDALVAEVKAHLAKLNESDSRTLAEVTFSGFIERAIRRDLAHAARSRKSKRKPKPAPVEAIPPSPACPVCMHLGWLCEKCDTGSVV